MSLSLDGPAPDPARPEAWDRPVPRLSEEDYPAYAGELTWCKRPRVTTPADLVRRRPDVVVVGVPFDDGVSHRPGARLAPRAIRAANSTTGDHSLALDIEPFRVLDVVDAGDVDIIPAWPERSLAVAYQRMRDILDTGAVPMVLGGDHSITWPVVSAVAEHARPDRIAMIHFDAHADTADDEQGVRTGHGTPMRRLIESGAVSGPALIQVGLRGYWPPPDVFHWMRDQGMRWHPMTEIEDRGIDAVIDDAIAEALEHADRIYVSVDIDVVDPGMAPGTGTPEPGGLLARELLRAVRRIVVAAPLAGLDVMEVSPPFDHAEVTAMLAHRCVFEAVSGMAARRRAAHEHPGQPITAERPTAIATERPGQTITPEGPTPTATEGPTPIGTAAR